MDLHRLEVFCKVVEFKSFTKASKAVFLSQPTVSEHIRWLEDALNVRLVDRLGREVLPTQAGKILYNYAQKILQLKDEAIQAIERYSGNLSGHLYIGASTIPGTYILPAILGLFKAKFPQIQTTLRIAGSRTVAESVISGDAELGIIGAHWSEPNLEWKKVFDDTLTLVVYPTHPFAKKKKISISELDGERFIFREHNSGTQKVMLQLMEERGFNPKKLAVVCEMGSTEAVKQSIKAHIGVAILSKRAVAEDLAAGNLVEVKIAGNNMNRPFYCISRKKRDLSPLCLAFYDFLLESSENKNG